MIREMASDDEIARAVTALRAGAVIGLPTETVYGLAGDAANPAAVARSMMPSISSTQKA